MVRRHDVRKWPSGRKDQIPYDSNGKKLKIPLRAVLPGGVKACTSRKLTAEGGRLWSLIHRTYRETEKFTNEEQLLRAKLYILDMQA